MKSEDIAIIILAVIAVISVFAMVSTGSLGNIFTGHATQGNLSLTVESGMMINFTTDTISWGSGRINKSGATFATLDTSNGSVANSNWTTNTAGFVIENIGNVNVTLNLSGGKTAATLLGGTSPVYQYNVTDVEANSLKNMSTFNEAFWNDVNSTARTIGNLSSADGSDTMRIDIKLVVPSDSRTGMTSDIITATIWT